MDGDVLGTPGHRQRDRGLVSANYPMKRSKLGNEDFAKWLCFVGAVCTVSWRLGVQPTPVSVSVLLFSVGGFLYVRKMVVQSRNRNEGRENMGRIRFVIKRENHYELTTVGVGGQKHVNEFGLERKPRGALFTDEGKYRRAIEEAVRETQA